jgi:hypothetical protein
MDKGATVKRAVEEAAAKRAAEEAMMKKAVEERAAAKATATEAAGAAGGSPAPARRRQRPGPRGLRLQVAPPRRTNVPTGVFRNLSLSNSLPLFPLLSFSYYLFVQVLFLRCGHGDGRGCRRCGCRGGFGAGSCQRASDPRRSP